MKMDYKLNNFSGKGSDNVRGLVFRGVFDHHLLHLYDDDDDEKFFAIIFLECGCCELKVREENHRTVCE